MHERLADGLYDQLLTAGLLPRLDGLQVVRQPVEDAESADRLGEHLGRVVAQHLARLPSDDRVAAANRLLATLGVTDLLEPGPERLLAAARQEEPGVWRLLQTRPQVPLSRPALLTNTSNDPKLGAELRAEIATADRIDLLCAFVKWYGLRVLEAELDERAKRGVPLRVLTTTYMGATDRTALDRLVRDFGAKVRVNYETQSTRRVAVMARRAAPATRRDRHADPRRTNGVATVAARTAGARPATLPPLSSRTCCPSVRGPDARVRAADITGQVSRGDA